MRWSPSNTHKFSIMYIDTTIMSLLFGPSLQEVYASLEEQEPVL
jgi:hypothetical protein